MIARIADFTIKTIVVFTTIVSLLVYASAFNALIFGGLSLIMLIALIIVSVASTGKSVQKGKYRKVYI